MPPTVTVCAPCRLHFGLLGFGGASERQFGGVGVMIDLPRLRVRFSQPIRAGDDGPVHQRVAHFAQRWADYYGLAEPPGCRIEVLEAPRSHVGLGSGTQLGLAVVQGLNHLFGRRLSEVDTARCAGRGLRSAVGTYGFFRGGLIWERGKTQDQTISPLERRMPIPASWRFVVICPREQAGLSGEGEQLAMDRLPPVPAEQQRQLVRIVEDQMLPALAQDACDAFGAAVYEYGRRSGEAFASVQGGVYNGDRLTSLVDRIRACGGIGVGQSSWGPALYVIVPNQPSATDLVAELTASGDLADTDVWVAGPDNRGARVEVDPAAG